MKYFLGLFLISVVFVSCNSGEIRFKRHSSGLEYSIVEKVSGDSLLKLGDVVVLNLSYETENGTVLFNSAKSDRKYLHAIAKQSHDGGCFEDGMYLVGVGDSAVFRINAEKFLMFTESYENLPKGVNPEDFVIVKLRVIEKLEKEDYSVILADKYHESENVETQLLEKYLVNANVTQKPTKSGFYYVEKKRGTGKQAMIGSKVSVNYSVSLIDGQLIETSFDKQPISFVIGMKQVIAAWDEGIALMKEGGRSTIIAPSKTAYGKDGKGTILPYSTLVFDVELIKVD